MQKYNYRYWHHYLSIYVETFLDLLMYAGCQKAFGIVYCFIRQASSTIDAFATTSLLI